MYPLAGTGNPASEVYLCLVRVYLNNREGISEDAGHDGVDEAVSVLERFFHRVDPVKVLMNSLYTSSDRSSFRSIGNTWVSSCIINVFGRIVTAFAIFFVNLMHG